jgi:hypothetical protein
MQGQPSTAEHVFIIALLGDSLDGNLKPAHLRHGAHCGMTSKFNCNCKLTDEGETHPIMLAMVAPIFRGRCPDFRAKMPALAFMSVMSL